MGNVRLNKPVAGMVPGSADVRTKFCLDHSVALLLVELAREL